jgi:hypothetical protein
VVGWLIALKAILKLPSYWHVFTQIFQRCSNYASNYVQLTQFKVFFLLPLFVFRVHEKQFWLPRMYEVDVEVLMKNSTK